MMRSPAPEASQVFAGEADQADPAPVSTATSRPLHVLLVSYWFPPVNIIGAVRMGKFAKYLHEAGHEVRVLAAAAPSSASVGMVLSNRLPLEIPEEQVARVAGWNVDEILDPFISVLRRLRRGDFQSRRRDGAIVRQTTKAVPRKSAWAKHYYALLRIPDARAGWIRAASEAGRDIVRKWQPDIVIGSAPPNSTLIVAKRIAHACGAPWIAELRDLWADNSYYDEPGWRLCLDRRLERRVLITAAGLATVTPIWADSLRRKYQQPVACIVNGYAEEDFPPEPRTTAAGQVVSIVYTGSIYAGYRDPTPLFRALELLGMDRKDVAVHLYGPDLDDAGSILETADSMGVHDRIFIHDRVSYKQSLAIQKSADVLLLLQWNNVKDAGNIPAKFFEYIGAGRPILLIGYEGSNLADMIRERRAGLVSNDPVIIAGQLLIGRYTGYRLSELFRFRDFLDNSAVNGH